LAMSVTFTLISPVFCLYPQCYQIAKCHLHFMCQLPSVNGMTTYPDAHCQWSYSYCWVLSPLLFTYSQSWCPAIFLYFLNKSSLHLHCHQHPSPSHCCLPPEQLPNPSHYGSAIICLQPPGYRTILKRNL
jgi:hypothetical protein